MPRMQHGIRRNKTALHADRLQQELGPESLSLSQPAPRAQLLYGVLLFTYCTRAPYWISLVAVMSRQR